MGNRNKDYKIEDLRAARLGMGLSQEEVAGYMNHTKVQVSMMELGQIKSPSSILLYGMVLGDVANDRGMTYEDAVSNGYSKYGNNVHLFKCNGTTIKDN